MGREIERKFLLASDAWRSHVARSQRMRQGYLCGNDRASIRVRVDEEGANLNIKSATLGVERDEYQYAIPVEEAHRLLDTLAGPQVEKTRYWVDVDGWEYEIDVFEGANTGLIVAELELPASDAEFPRPEWLGEEVSHDPRYYNTELARNPYRDWPDAS
ncbi:adenylate cyclase [Thioalkalivibrio sp. K90mix]|uniref:CYTH domain-containing protein n=1 Tax=Thioalkalivibrio sp. (strain K90mix) TaxID=396595 RepID=UPI000195A423|nr:CYTH domain-containing protein [Thioalkalivibrio sp. K90mix]ADC72097.1 adenylate cyclase [Thioalkalivibrio sp. K90mix]